MKQFREKWKYYTAFPDTITPAEIIERNKGEIHIHEASRFNEQYWIDLLCEFNIFFTLSPE